MVNPLKAVNRFFTAPGSSAPGPQAAAPTAPTAPAIPPAANPPMFGSQATKAKGGAKTPKFDSSVLGAIGQQTTPAKTLLGQ